MHVHVIFAHPAPDSLNGACLQRVLDTLVMHGHTVDLLDLYRDGFDPVMSEDEQHGYKAGQPAPIARSYGARLHDAEALVFVFPTWWYGAPAILKGYLDRVWSRGIVFEEPAKPGRPPKPLLTQLQRFVVVTTAGGPKLFMRWLMGDPVKRVMMRGIKRMCAGPTGHDFLCLYGAETASPAAYGRFLDRVEATIARLPRPRPAKAAHRA